MSRKKTKEEILVEFRNIHGDKYDYSMVEYINSKTPVAIICQKHGEFLQRPGDHKNGSGCPKCAIERGTEIKTKSQEEIIKEFKHIHGNMYDYSLVEYNGMHKPVTIICYIHGPFRQLPTSHKNGCGCPYCYGTRKKTKDEVIEDFTNVHGNIYHYYNMNYVGNNTKVCITCPIHGDFWQTPSNHKAGQGCPYCNNSHMEEKVRMILERNNIKYEQQKTFPWLKSLINGSLKLDFYLPDYNIAIECQGIQHFMPNDFYTEIDVEKNKQRDNLKLKLCEEHNISIFYIRYDENIEESINTLISKISKL